MNDSIDITATITKPGGGDEPSPRPSPEGIVSSITAEADGPITTMIDPPVGWQLVNVRELWRYRELLYFLTWRDVKVRYKQTLLGAAWAILQPVMMMMVFIVIFARMAKVPSANTPYPVFVFAGLLPWTFFSTALANGAASVVGSERLITKIYFPRLAIPFAAVGAALVDFALAFGVLLVLMIWYHIMPGVQVLLIPFLVLVLTFAALGVGTLLAALTVAYRDFKYVVPFLLQLWLFATPSVYMDVFTSGGGSAKLQMMLWINPMVSVVASFRAVMLGEPLHWDYLIVSAAFSALALIVGCLYFRKVEDSFADVV
jgi:homopolymeric O-antigen transport system permease protein